MAEDSGENQRLSGAVGILNFSDAKKSDDTSLPSKSSTLTPTIDILCLFCEKSYTFYAQKDEYLAHLYLEHRLVIGDEHQVAIFHEYLVYWRQHFNGMEDNLPTYCTTMLLDHLPDGTASKNEKYYLLCDVLPQDHELRQQLHTKRLEQTLEQHQFERVDTSFERDCLFCRDIIKTTRSDYVKHLFSKHFLQLGKPENLVYIDDLVNTVQIKLNALICVFCEKLFRDRPTLKEHMRKKGHKRINPNNTNYDRFFLVNYQSGKFSAQQTKRGKPNKKDAVARNKQIMHTKKKANTTGKRSQHDDDSSSENGNETTLFESDNDSNWSDWDGDQQEITCLFCTQKARDSIKVKEHMKDVHGIDFDGQTQKLTFYDRVKVVNFLRRIVYLGQCVVCDEKHTENDQLVEHMKSMGHFSIGTREQWDKGEYFYSTYEDDPFLCSLHDSNGPSQSDDDYEDITGTEKSPVVVVPEDTTVSINLHAEALSKERLSEI